MKKWLLMLILLLTGCSAGELKTVDQLYEKAKVVEETMSKDVVVHTVIGTGQGEVVAMDERSKWIEVELSIVSQHPMSLVEASNGKVYKAELVGFNENANKAYLKVKSSLPLEENVELVEGKSLEQELTYKERLALKERFQQVKGTPSEKIVEYEEQLFTQNPDEVEAFIDAFEKADDKESFVANDLLLATLQEASESEIRYTLQQIEAVAVGKTGITVIGEIVFMDAEGSETAGQITYTVTQLDGHYKIINIQLSE